MRIICDHCDRPISGTVKRMPENLNFHPQCLADLAKEASEELAPVSLRRQEPSVRAWVDGHGRVRD